ncbi:HlyD family efflux transporter periplasmic adaptor subunit [Methylomarinum sp. Ch1-1]|uniref:HlyD family efflux transporter periplasmic adaptor subunit n=1 Tax=Methylomarinum roseum TaxID=3067653 RepID=A0AAU7NY80_9GAMM|nr:HlyD family efflux transporter periplasmic adaptor subunit [Methylomarinum sp. Ch1-1]MDP4521945.1 HlyD family efflux transporter periplasmic adaptor subunit [Methylomarinum sp. Ch1-1]
MRRLRTQNSLTAMSAAQTPRMVSRLARLFAWLFIVIPLVMLFVPWQQNVTGIGRVAAYAPVERQQTVDATVSGRIVQWHVKEGDRVRQGDKLVEIRDFDPLFKDRLQQQQAAASAKVAAKEQELQAYRLQRENLIAVRDIKVATAQYKLDVARQKVRSAVETLAATRATLDAARLQRERLQNLLSDGLVSRREFELAERDLNVALRSRNSTQASLQAARASEQAALADIERIRADAEAKISGVNAYLNKTLSELEESRASLVKFEVALARQQSQVIEAPRDGTILRLLSNPEAQVLKQGDPLAILIPSTDQYAVELWLDGNDAPLTLPGHHVRLQFEGWPAVQFVGWPEVAVGTFGGQVAFVDSTDNGNGKFRVMVVPDEQDRNWPSSRFLRQGVRVRGWVLLNQVTLGYEIWRQLNGFPPMLTPESPLSDIARKRLQ